MMSRRLSDAEQKRLADFTALRQQKQGVCGLSDELCVCVCCNIFSRTPFPLTGDADRDYVFFDLSQNPLKRASWTLSSGALPTTRHAGAKLWSPSRKRSLSNNGRT